MSWADAYLMALRSIGRRLGRALLTVVAVALGAALLSALLIAVSAARSRVFDAISKGGPLTGIEVFPATPSFGQLDSDTARLGAPRPIDEAARRRISRIPGVASVAALSSVPVFVVPPVPPTPGRDPTVRVAPFSDSLTGVDLRHARQLPITVLAGRLPQARSLHEVVVTDAYLHHVGVSSTQGAAVLGTVLEVGAPRLFVDAGSETVRGRWTRSTIVGVVAAQGTNGEIIGSLEQVQAARAWSAASDATSNPDLQKFAAGLRGASIYSGLFVVTNGLTEVTTVRAKINTVGFSTSAPESLIASVQRYSQVVEIVLSGIGFIGLSIAALGITNAMLAAVRERRREIGVLKAIGARDRDVRRIFLIEAALLGLSGGFIGTVTGYVIARVVGFAVNHYLTGQGLGGVQVNFPAGIVIAGIVGSGILALIAGTVPAQRAARLPARQAMGDA